MNRSGLWTVIVVTAAWTGFLLGYAVSAHTGVKPVVVAKAETGGYGCVPAVTQPAAVKPAAGAGR